MNQSEFFESYASTCALPLEEARQVIERRLESGQYVASAIFGIDVANIFWSSVRFTTQGGDQIGPHVLGDGERIIRGVALWRSEE